MAEQKARATPAANTGIINIRGKEYHTVAKRVQDFRKDRPDYTIQTSVHSAADLVLVKATIRDSNGRKLATGYAEENRAAGINVTSAIENAETSAVGRALAFLGYGGMEIASADEMQSALEQQDAMERIQYLMKHNDAVRDHIESILVMKQALLSDKHGIAKEAWQEIPEDDQHALWVAPSKGGIFTTEERNKMKSDEWRNAS